jgi:hypothetical protein
VERRIAPTVRIEDPIEQALLDGVSSPDKLSQLGRLGRSSSSSGPPGPDRRGRDHDRHAQVRGSLERFVSSVIPDTRRIVRTRPLEALVIGVYVRAQTRLSLDGVGREHRVVQGARGRTRKAEGRQIT